MTGDDIARGLLGVRSAWLDRSASAADIGAVARSTTWPVPHAAEAVRRAFAPFTQAALSRLVRAGARPPPPAGDQTWLLAILAGRIPALAVNAVFWSLAARVPVVLKPPAAEPVFASLLAASVARESPALGDLVRVFVAPSGSAAQADLLRRAPVCLAYGGDATFDAIRAARPGLPTFGGGHRESLAVLFRESLAATRLSSLAAALASDVAIYDQSGCLSPHVVLVERGGEVGPADVAAALASALRTASRSLPPAPIPLGDAVAIRMFVEECRLVTTRRRGAVFPVSGPVPPAVVLAAAAPARPGPGWRVVQVVAFDGPPDLPSLVPWMAGHVQGIAAAGDRRRLDETLAAHPAFAPSIACRPGRLQLPPADWPENGRVLTRELALLRADSRRPGGTD